MSILDFDLLFLYNETVVFVSNYIQYEAWASEKRFLSLYNRNCENEKKYSKTLRHKCHLNP